VRYALWAENDQPLSTEIPLFVPLGRGMKVVGEFEAYRKGYRLFHKNGTLTNEAFINSKEIMKYEKLIRNGGHPKLMTGYSKYTTKTYMTPKGHSVETHFYADPNSGIIDYGLDYKTKLPINYWR